MSRLLLIAAVLLLTVTALSQIPGPTYGLVYKGVDPVSWWKSFSTGEDSFRFSIPNPAVDSPNTRPSPAGNESQTLPLTSAPEFRPVAPANGPTAPSDPTEGAGVSDLGLTLEQMKLSLLELINGDRLEHGLDAVALDHNPAAQRHAEDLRAFCYLSHWGRDGLKPYMRYALAGGQNANAENVAGFTACGGNRARLSLDDAVTKAQQGFMDSLGHRETILTPEFRKVSLGISCDDLNYCWMVQQFQGDYVQFAEPPRFIGRRILSMAGSLKNGVVLAPESLSTIWYDQPPHDLTLGQLGRTCSYRVGQVPVAFVRPPAPAGSFYLDDDETFFYEKLASDPYSASPDLPRRHGNRCGETTVAQTVLPALDALTFEQTDTSFKIQADLTEEIARHGPGVYIILVWGVDQADQESEPFVIINYPIIVDAP